MLNSSSSSSGRNGNEPKLSGRNKRDLLFLAVGLCGGIGYHLSFSDSDWEDEVVRTAKHQLMASLLSATNRNASNRGGLGNDSEKMNGIISTNPASRGHDNTNHHRFASHQEELFSDRSPPAVVRKYIASALLPSSLSPTSSSSSDGISARQKGLPPLTIANIHQSGEFYAMCQWYPFEATQMASTSMENPGFVWEARTTILLIPNHVLEYYVPRINDNNNNNKIRVGEGKIVTKAWGKYPLIQIEEDDPYLFFWLAMTPLFPAVFLSQQEHQQGKVEILRWNNNENNLDEADQNQTRASAQLLCDDGENRLVEFFFREDDGMLRRIRVSSCTDKEEEPWQATYEDYKQFQVGGISKNRNEKLETDRDPRGHRGGAADQNRRQPDESLLLVVPSKIEIGKGEGDQYRPHFKINNHHLEYCKP